MKDESSFEKLDVLSRRQFIGNLLAFGTAVGLITLSEDDEFLWKEVSEGFYVGAPYDSGWFLYESYGQSRLQFVRSEDMYRELFRHDPPPPDIEIVAKEFNHISEIEMPFLKRDDPSKGKYGKSWSWKPRG